MAGTSRSDLQDQLARWVAEGLIDAKQASSIEAAEATRAESAPVSTPQPAAARPGGRASLVVETLGYLGGAMAIIAGFLAVAQLWPDIPPGAEAAFAAVATVLLGIVGAVMRTDGDPAFGRLRSVLWLMSTASLAAFTGVLAARIWDFSSASTLLLSAAATTLYAALLWLRTEAPLQHLAMFAGAAVTLGAAIGRFDADTPVWVLGLAVWTLSAAWAGTVQGGYLRPRTAGYLAAAVGLLVGAQMMMEVAAGHLVALATVAALLAGGVALRKVWLLAIGAFGVVQFVPQTADQYLPNSLAAPLAIFAVGVILLGVALLLAKWARSPKASNKLGPATP